MAKRGEAKNIIGRRIIESFSMAELYLVKKKVSGTFEGDTQGKVKK